MEINKGEANKERERASKKEICYAHKPKHGCGEGERERTSFVHCITLLLVTARVAIKTELRGVGTLFGSEFVRKRDKS